MASMTPMALWGLEVPCGDVAISASPDIPSAFRITMAAIDPSADPEGDEGALQRATLKVIRQPLDTDGFSDEDDDDDEDMDDFDADEMERLLALEAENEDDDDDEDDEDEDDEDEDVAGEGPSDPAKSKKARRAAAAKEIAALLKNGDDHMEIDGKPNGVNGAAKSAKAKGKGPAIAGELDDKEDEDDDEDSDDDDEPLEMEEFVMCTLDPNGHYQQPLDITIGEDERVWFKVTGTHSIFLTGNYVEPPVDHHHGLYDPEDDEEDEYDLEPDEDELDDEEDELDDMEDPRIMEVEEEAELPKLVEAAVSKKKTADKKAESKKRAAPDSDDAAAEEGVTVDELISKSLKAAEPATNGELKLSKKQLKKLKKNDGSAAAAAAAPSTAKTDVDTNSSAKSDKKVSFAKDLEQGPTPTKDSKKADAADDKAAKSSGKATLGTKVVQGVTIEDKKLGTGPAAKAGDRVSMRYIGKLKSDNKVFDSNTKGKPFAFALGAGDVIKGWDIGVAGLSVGGERRITIPAALAYGSKGAPPQIPPNATLVFDVKLLNVAKK